MGLLDVLGLEAKTRDAPAPGAKQRDGGDALVKAKAEVEAGLSSVTALVLGGITNDAQRTAINDELAKLKAAQAKAAAIADPKAALIGYTALAKSVKALDEKARAVKDARDVDEATVAPLATAARTAIGSLQAAAKAKLQAELDTIEAERARLLAANDAAGLRSGVAPRLTKLRDVATTLPAASKKVDADLARAARALARLDAADAAPLAARLKALQDEKQGDWPAGKSADEMAASFDRVSQGANTIAAEAEALGPRLKDRREIADLRKRLDALKPRTDRAAQPPEAPFMAADGKRVTDALVHFARFEAASDLKSCEILFSQIGALLDKLDSMRELLRAQRQRFAAARDGGIKEALAAKLTPATLAAMRAKSLEGKRADIESKIDGGNLVAADKAIDAWLKLAKTWGEAPDAYANLRSGQPKKATMQALIGKPGGGEVFDALVADLPDKETSTETMTTALEARFGTKVEQFNHRRPGEDLAAKDKKYKDPREKTNPKHPQKGLKDLYRTLRMVPVRDVAYTESITDYEEQGEGGFHRGKPGGGDEDRIVLYAGRPDDEKNTLELGGTTPPGEKPDPDCQPEGGTTVNAYTQTALHEVAHGLDDARNVMAGHMAEAGWKACSAGEVAKTVAQHLGYDESYVLALMADPDKLPPTQPKRPANVKTDDEWTRAHDKVVTWVRLSCMEAKPWDNSYAAKQNAIGGRVYHESGDGEWVSYLLAARAKGISGYQFRAPAEWFAELYSAFHMGKLGPKHPSAGWLKQLQAESEAGST